MGLLTLTSACGFKVKHEITLKNPVGVQVNDVGIDVGPKMGSAIDQIRNGGKRTSEAFQNAKSAVDQGVRTKLGQVANATAPRTDVAPKIYSVYLMPREDGRFSVRLLDGSDQELILDLDLLTLDTVSGRFPMVTDLSTGSTFNWWFQDAGDQIQLILNPNENTQRFEGSLLLYFH
jgi:hypothetical protein